MSDKAKNKVNPRQRILRRLWSATAILLFLISVAIFLSWRTDSSSGTLSEQDFAARATQLIADATGTAIVFLDNNNCEMIEATRWRISIFFDSDGALETERSGGRNSTVMNNWYCEDTYQYEHVEYFVDVFIETDEIEFVTLVNEVFALLEAYPPDHLPLLEPIIQLQIIQPAETMFPSGRYTLNYDEAMQAYESGLRGQSLLDAVATSVE